MDESLPAKLLVVEEQLREQPDSEWLHIEAVTAFMDEQEAHPRRIHHIQQLVRRFPRCAIARSPFAQVDPELSPDGFQLIADEWLTHRQREPSDPDITRGYALFIARSDPASALDLLRRTAASYPSNSDIPFDIASVSDDPVEQLQMLRLARQLGSTHPNLLPSIAQAALAAADMTEAEQSGTALLEAANAAQESVDIPIPPRLRGVAAWNHIRAVAENHPDRPQLIDAVAQHAYFTHWGHTALGAVALLRGEPAVAASHLLQSIDVVAEPRLASYGPSFMLASRLCRADKWDAVADYLQRVAEVWDCEHLDDWLVAVNAKNHPDFPDD